ncbi:hypothetical protein ASD99_28950 [Mesorhizobium sp. Root695]|nr:hypothetical protein ASD99_28950 [Mesorhizobium sp. Root695]
MTSSTRTLSPIAFASQPACRDQDRQWRSVRQPQRAVQPQQAVGLVAAAGIDIERIKPGCPQQNGRHERMHLTLKKETTKPAGANFLQQPGSMTSSTSQTVGIKQAEDHIWLARRFNL